MVNTRRLSVFIIFFSFLFLYSGQVFAEGTYSSLGTGDAADGSADAINFSQGRVWTIDQYGKYIWTTQVRSGETHWAWSNDQGANWSQSSEAYSFLTRASVAYDSINDVLHVIWGATDNNDGIIYRRYSITRDGSNNITSIQRVNTGVNLQLDTTSSRSLEQPVAIWLNDGSADGTLLAFWSKHGTSLNEVRVSMRRLSMTDADGVAGNWVTPDGTADTISTDAPAVAVDQVYFDTSGVSAVSAKIRGGTGSHKDDLYVFVAEEDDNSGDQVLAYRATWNSGSTNWSGGWAQVGAMGAMNTASGYSLKYQLITKPVIDTTNDRLYVGWARWDTTLGDTASMSYLSASDTISSTVDLYSANGTHSYAPTLDLSYDSTLDLIYGAYVLSTTNGDNGSIDYKSYNGTTLSSSTRFYTTPGGSAGANGGADIPVLYENRQNGRLLFGFRINGALPPTGVNPHTIDWGYITLATPTPTPTATPTPTPTTVPTNSSTSGGGPSSSEPSTPRCEDTAPTETPYIGSAVAVSGSQVDLIYSSWSQYYTLEYGLLPTSFIYAVSGIPEGSFSVRFLIPNTTYYFRVAAKNGCTIGPWSNVVKVRTKGAGFQLARSPFVRSTNPVTKPTTANPTTLKEEPTITIGPTSKPVVSPTVVATTAPAQATTAKPGFFSSVFQYFQKLF